MSKFNFYFSKTASLVMNGKILETASGRLKWIACLFCFVFLSTYPKYVELLLDPNPIGTFAYFFEKINAPLTPVHLSEDTHGSKIAFRLVPPVLAKILGLGQGSGRAIVLLYVIQSLMLFPFLLLLTNIFRRFMSNKAAMLLTIGFSAIYVSKAFFWDYDFWFDGYAYFFLLMGMGFRNKLAIFCSLQLACWTDERAVVALASVYLFHLLQETNFEFRNARQILNSGFLNRNSSIVLFVGFVYLFVRLFLARTYQLTTPLGAEAGVGLASLPFQLKHRLIGVFLSFEGGWLLFLLALRHLFSVRNYLVLLTLVTLTLIHILIAYCVYDITRSLAYAFPLFIITGIILAREYPMKSHTALLTAMVICLLIPTQFLIYYPRQIPWTVASFQEFKPILKSMLIGH